MKATEFILNMNINNIDEFNDDLYFDINTWSIEDDGNILDEDEIEITIINNTGI